jgi:hypothetical protein
LGGGEKKAKSADEILEMASIDPSDHRSRGGAEREVRQQIFVGNLGISGKYYDPMPVDFWETVRAMPLRDAEESVSPCM